MSIDALSFKQAEEALGYHFVGTVANSTHVSDQVMFSQEALIRPVGNLTATV
jgi:hypothetical protein